MSLSFVFVSAVVAAVVPVLYLRWLAQRRARDDVNRLPGPSSRIATWLWGHELLAFENDANEMYNIWVRQFGPLFKIKAALFHPDIIIATDHAAVQHIFANSKTYVKTPAFRGQVGHILGEGLVWAEGDEHIFQRRLLSRAFTTENIKGMADDVFGCAEQLEDLLANRVRAHGREGTLVNIAKYTIIPTLDIIGRVGFGHDFKAVSTAEFDSTEAPQTDAQTIVANWEAFIHDAYTFTTFLALAILRVFPTWLSAQLSIIQTQSRISTTIARIAAPIVSAARRGEHTGNGKDVLSILTRTAKDSKGTLREELSDETIIANINTFLIAGTTTTSDALNFILLELAQHPEAQQKLRDEVLTNESGLDYDSVQRLSYLDAVVKEGLRLHSPLPQPERIALQDDVIPLSMPIRTEGGTILDSIRVSKGQAFYLPAMTAQTNPSVWGPDAHTFLPERWLRPGGIPPPNKLPHGWSGLLAFCDGPRNCIGSRLAVLEMKVILAVLIRSLEFRDTGVLVRQRLPLTPMVNGEVGVLPLRVAIAPPASGLERK
ncbi:hypothetical protein PLICRDRAFT_46431 [Plicaturopsis crispa FD-325 SS-3]|uniref:Cytochrome P450 n=1 Tax=Plicaturopsis crispa FD-325 SS-3 TaxID=944288 RepID=A0A0C9T449_PLICR|nr:hypothetical protein PLICRDRAFT_46431 [Plicaturopsis crispa FD-325 SS-3]